MQFEVFFIKWNHVGILLPQGNSNAHEASNKFLELLRVCLQLQEEVLIRSNPNLSESHLLFVSVSV